MDTLSSHPTSFSELQANPPQEFILSDVTVDPVLVVTRQHGKIEVKLAGTWKSRGRKLLIFAPSIKHCWLADARTIRPLPKDTSSVIQRMIGDADPNDLPYSLVLKWLRTEEPEISIEANDTFSTPASIEAKKLDPSISIDGLEATLFTYQAQGVSWMHQTISQVGGLILADEMGLGKTLQIIALLSMSPPPCNAPALIVCPTSLITNWTREISRFSPNLTVLTHRGANRTGVHSKLRTTNIVITTYDTMVNDISIFSAFEWSWVICDEAQAIKNPNSNRRIAVASIPRRRTIPMTGTPIENSLVDLWSLADIAVPGILGAQRDFEIQFPDSVESAKRLSALTNPIILKRKVEDVAGDLPERLDVDIPLSLDETLATQYRKVREQTLAKYPVAGNMVATLQLQLFCAHPWLRKSSDSDVDGEYASLDRLASCPLITPKMERALALLQEAFTNGQKVLLFSTFNRINDLVREAGRSLPEAFWGAINGSTASELRQPIIDEFTEHQGPACLVLNPKAAGAGLNITAATVVIHFTPVWNPATEAQASARAHRRGQTRPVTIYRLYYENTVEEVMLARALWKQQMGDEILPDKTRDREDLAKALAIEPLAD